MSEGGIVGLAIDVILLATLGIAAVSLLISANMTGWGTTNTMIFGTILPLIVGIAFLLLILKRAGYQVKI